MSEVCKLEYNRDDGRTYPVGIHELKESQQTAECFEKESTTYVDVLHFVRDIFSLLDFTGIIRGEK